MILVFIKFSSLFNLKLTGELLFLKLEIQFSGKSLPNFSNFAMLYLLYFQNPSEKVKTDDGDSTNFA